jgi:tetratricopeptide (TPR) repeat protein
VLAAFLAAAAGVATLSVPFHASWLKPSGAVIAAVGAVAAAVLAVGRARLDSKREIYEADARLRVPVARVKKVDPTLIGVDPAAKTELGGTLPTYVPRIIDNELYKAIETALAGQDAWLVVIVGQSKAGKSRALFEALRRYDTDIASLQLLAPDPQHVGALESLLLPGEEPPIGDESAVLWLDDIEPFLNQGVTFETLRKWRAGGPNRIVAATYGGKGSEQIADSPIGGITTIIVGVLQHAQQIPLDPTSPEELEPLSDQLSANDFEALVRYGLAAYLVAGPLLERQLATGRHPADPIDPCPEGVALANAAIDWTRCGRSDAIRKDALRALWESYLPSASIAGSNDGFDRALTWALRPVAGTIALLQRSPEGSYQAYDYAVQLRRRNPGVAPPKDAVWATAIETASPGQAFAVGLAAAGYSGWLLAREAFGRAAGSENNKLASGAQINQGFALASLGRLDEALAAYRQVIDRHGEDPAFREQVAMALVNTNLALSELGRWDEALAACQQVIDHYSDDPDPPLRLQVAKALLGGGVNLGKLGRSDEALAAYQQVIDHYSSDPDPALRVQVAKALVNRGIALQRLGRSDEALAACNQVIDHYSDDPDPALRVQVVRALVHRGIALDRLGRSDEALAAYQQIIDHYSSDPDPALREEVARALYNRGIALGKLGRWDEALAAHQQFIDDQSSDPDPALRESVAKALYNRGIALGQLDRADEELAAYQQVIDHYSSDPAPALRVQVAKALVNAGAALGKLGRWDEALAAWQQVIDRYDEDPDLRESVAKALVNRGIALDRLGP